MAKNMYLQDEEKAREYIKDKLEDIKKQRDTCIDLKGIKYLCRALKSNEEFLNYIPNIASLFQVKEH